MDVVVRTADFMYNNPGRLCGVAFQETIQLLVDLVAEDRAAILDVLRKMKIDFAVRTQRHIRTLPG